MHRVLVSALVLATFAAQRSAADAAPSAVGGDASESAIVLAGNGPRGVVVRWYLSSSARVSIVRIDGSGERGAPIVVARANVPADHLGAALANVKTSGDDIAPSDLATIADVDRAVEAGVAYVDTTATRGRSYRYDVTFANGKHVVSPAVTAGAPPPVGRFSPPTLTASAGDRFVSLRLSPAPTSLVRLRIERSTNGAFAFERSVLLAPSAHAVGNVFAPARVSAGNERALHLLAPGDGLGDAASIVERTSGRATAQFRVRAFDEFGNVGAASVPVSVQTIDLSRLPAVASLSVSRSGESVALHWTAPAGQVSSYAILRASGARVPEKTIATVPGSQTTYEDASVQRGVAYRYDVRALNALGNLGVPSRGRTAVLPKLQAPAAPPSLATSAAPEGATLTWPASNDASVRAYEIYRRIPGHAPILVATLPVGAHSFVDRASAQSLAGAEYGIGLRDRFGNAALPAAWRAGRSARAAIATAPLSATRANGGVAVAFAPIGDPTIAQRIVYRSIDGGPPQKIATLAHDATSYVDSTASEGHTYAYTTAYLDTAQSVGPKSISRSSRLFATPKIALQTGIDASGRTTFAIVGKPAGARCTVLRRDGAGPFTIADSHDLGADSRAATAATTYVARCTSGGTTVTTASPVGRAGASGASR